MTKNFRTRILTILIVAFCMTIFSGLSAQKEMKDKSKENKNVTEETKKGKPENTDKTGKPDKADRENKGKDSKEKNKDKQKDNSNKTEKLKGAERKIERLKEIATKLESQGKTEQASKIREKIKKAESTLQEKKTEIEEGDDSEESMEEEK
ncbi:hypothetical protein [Leptospira sp. GIMC2001]|uniref:hypothetical protein n=1 Tax=Leptospira sp. GIMC2001 TaxID=1513297 RepID=UPI002349E468|nr:hypothetical protein [Leptospira sp. GIMC2001]WCL49475.1 hypothetical protein O4O04_19630 [Leptospira sp. GIMC2001]